MTNEERVLSKIHNFRQQTYDLHRLSEYFPRFTVSAETDMQLRCRYEPPTSAPTLFLQIDASTTAITAEQDGCNGIALTAVHDWNQGADVSLMEMIGQASHHRSDDTYNPFEVDQPKLRCLKTRIRLCVLEELGVLLARISDGHRFNTLHEKLEKDQRQLLQQRQSALSDLAELGEASGSDEALSTKASSRRTSFANCRGRLFSSSWTGNDVENHQSVIDNQSTRFGTSVANTNSSSFPLSKLTTTMFRGRQVRSGSFHVNDPENPYRFRMSSGGDSMA